MTKKLSTLVKNEKVKVRMIPGRYVLRPHGKTPVQLKDGGWSEIDVEPIALETEGEYRMGLYTRLYDENDPKDAETLRLLRAELQAKPYLATHVDFQIKIVGEYDEGEPWAGYDDQNADQVELYWRSMPDRMKFTIALEDVMKHELSRVDEAGDSITDDAKVKVLNKLYKEQVTQAMDSSEETVAL